MASVRRGQGPMILNLPNGPPNDLPPISALFLIYFDIKAGYTIGWKRSLPGIELEGVVEYKSLPSGLHTVKNDLIYFVHDNHAGLSAFVNTPAGEESRNARMIAVGVMVPLSYGRLGRSWKHAGVLKDMAKCDEAILMAPSVLLTLQSELIIDTTKTEVLEEFWEEHKAHGISPADETEVLLDSPRSLKYKPIRTALGRSRGHGRNRSASDGNTLLLPGLSVYHPAWSLPHLLETFGPLIFPIHRAALLRKRILIVAHAPVEETCNFVYDLSVLSNIPLAVSDLLASNAPPQRLRPLFSIGIHDIPLLEDDLRASQVVAATIGSEEVESREETGCGWIACTTDSILAMKSALYDVLITMPPVYSESATEKVWPKVESPQGVEMKASQRDLRRYQALRWGLSHHTSPPPSTASIECVTARASPVPPRNEPMLDIPDTEHIVEPLSWSALAYSGFMWWASAGEQRIHSEEESEADAGLLSGLSLSPSTPQTPKTPFQPATRLKGDDGTATQEMGLIAYFHRLTTQILTTLSDIVDVTDTDDERDDGKLLEIEENGPAVYVSSADVVRMGLDVWSSKDHEFIENVAWEYFGRRAQVEGRSVDICGVRIC